MEDREELKEILEHTDHVIYSVLRHVSQSGMQRAISFYVIDQTNKSYSLRMIDGYISRILGLKFNKKHDGLTVNGAGMDMGFHVVNSLSIALYCAKGYTHEGAYKLSNRWL